MLPVAAGAGGLVIRAIGLAKAGRVGIGVGSLLGGGISKGTIKSALVAILAGLGADTVLDWLLEVGFDDDRASMWENFIDTLDEMEQTGLIYPWTPRDNMRTPGIESSQGPRYLIFDLSKGQGFYSNFHMSRAGLRAHDDKQDTIKRPRRARRRSK